MSIFADACFVVGVDTHTHTHTAVIVHAVTGAVVDEITAPASVNGYRQLVRFADAHPGRRVWAIEGAGCYGVGFHRHLNTLGETVIEAERPNRPARRDGKKSDALDATRAAREALTRTHLGQPRTPDGIRQTLTVVTAARRSCVDAARVATQQLKALVITAPDPLRQRLSGLSTTRLVTTAAALRPSPRSHTPTTITAHTLKTLARRIRTLQKEAAGHHTEIHNLVRQWRPDLLELTGVGPISAATILCAWSHPGRFRSEAAFANLAGTAPIPASTGQTTRHRLNRHGDRHLNQAIYTITITRLRTDPTTQTYHQHARTNGKTTREIIRCLKRYITRQIYRQLEHHTP